MRSPWAVAAVTTLAVLSGSHAFAQAWSGPYLGGTIGAAVVRQHPDEVVEFDTDLNGAFGDTVRTLAGADAFSPGFCGGLAVDALAASGCSDDENDIDAGGRFGYDWQFGRVVFGGLVEVSSGRVTDTASAFSTTPAFYSFTRKMDMALGLRARVGAGSDRVLVYGTGGPAWARVRQQFTTSNRANAFVAVNQEGEVDDEGFSAEGVWGYQAGGGVEVRLVGGVTLIGEYLFHAFDNREVSTVRATPGTAPPTNPFLLVNPAGTDLRRTEALKFQTIRLGLTYRF